MPRRDIAIFVTREPVQAELRRLLFLRLRSQRLRKGQVGFCKLRVSAIIRTLLEMFLGLLDGLKRGIGNSPLVSMDF